MISFHACKIVGGKSGNQVDGKLRMRENRVFSSEERVGKATVQLVWPTAFHVEVEQREFAIDRRPVPANGFVAVDPERSAKRGNDVENLLDKMLFAQTSRDRRDDLGVVESAGNRLVLGRVDRTQIRLRHSAASSVIFRDAAGNRRILVDDDQYAPAVSLHEFSGRKSCGNGQNCEGAKDVVQHRSIQNR